MWRLLTDSNDITVEGMRADHKSKQKLKMTINGYQFNLWCEPGHVHEKTTRSTTCQDTPVLSILVVGTRNRKGMNKDKMTINNND